MTRTRAESYWIGGGAAAAVLLAGASWLFVIHPQLAKTDSLHAKTADTRMQNAALAGNVARLRKANDNIGAARQSLAAAQAALPADAGIAALSQQLTAQAADAGVTVQSLIAGTPTTASTAAPGATTGAAGAAPSAAATPSAAPTPSAAATPASAANPAGGAVAGQLYAIPITLTVAGTPARDLLFLHAVQTSGPRAALVTSAALAAGTGTSTAAATGTTTLTVQLQVFTAPTAPSGTASTGG